MATTGIRNIPQNLAQSTPLPQEVKEQLAIVAISGLHDTLWTLVALSSVGLLRALLLKGSHLATSKMQH